MSEKREEGQGFLHRWARLKAGAETPEEAGERPAAKQRPAAVEEADGEPPEDLRGIDVDALDPETTDFARFLKEDVPEWLRRKALRRLWESDPVLANLDGLNDYDEDFTSAGIAQAAADFIRRGAELLEKRAAGGAREEERDESAEAPAPSPAPPSGEESGEA